MRPAVLGCALFAAMPGVASPAAAYALLGSGAASCDAWTRARQAPQAAEAAMHQQWLLGFLSGVGFMMLGELDPLHGMDAQAVYVWVDGYCRSHPQEQIEAAARAFTQEHPR